MKTFGQIQPKDYTIQPYYASSPLSWRLVSSSFGIIINDPEELYGAVTINRASNNGSLFYQEREDAPINTDTDIYEYVLYSSIKHIFYDDNVFYSGSVKVTESIAGLPDESYVVGIGQDFYGERVKPGSFELQINTLVSTVNDDGKGNLFVSQSNDVFYVGNIFYNQGIAVIKNNTTSAIPVVNSDGITILDGTNVLVSYDTTVQNERHEINIRLKPSEFNISPFNPSVKRTLIATGSVTQSFIDAGANVSSSGEWPIQELMQAGVIKPYVTSIGLFNDTFDLVAVAKLSTPIQRTFESDQIFIVRFDI